MVINNFHFRPFFCLDKSRQKKRNSRKEPFQSSKIQKFGRENLENIDLRSSQIFNIFVLRVEIVTISEPKVLAISARSKIMRKFANFVRLYLPHITTFFNQILVFYYF